MLLAHAVLDMNETKLKAVIRLLYLKYDLLSAVINKRLLSAENLPSLIEKCGWPLRMCYPFLYNNCILLFRFLCEEVDVPVVDLFESISTKNKHRGYGF